MLGTNGSYSIAYLCFGGVAEGKRYRCDQYRTKSFDIHIRVWLSVSRLSYNKFTQCSNFFADGFQLLGRDHYFGFAGEGGGHALFVRNGFVVNVFVLDGIKIGLEV